MLHKDKDSFVFISCGIFREELEYLVRERGLGWEIIFLDAALHVNFDRLKSQLTEALRAHRNSGARIKVVYGHCHPEIEEILKPFGAKRIRAGNCLEAIVGADEIRKIDSEAKTFFLTAGWVSNWERIFAAGKEDLGLDFGKLFAGYRRIVVFDSGVIPIDKGKVDALSRFAGLTVERRRISLDHLHKVISSI